MVQKHKKPSDQSPSVFLIQALEKFCTSAKVNSGPALDLPCGFGRNSLYLSKKYSKVFCADYDIDVFSDRWYDSNRLTPILLNAKKELPFKSDTFGLVTIIHFYTDDLFSKISCILKKGGIVIFESYGGQGQNWKELPTKDHFREDINEAFEILYFKENIVGPEKTNITVKMVAIKR